jgi:hypothetical protein
VIAGYAGKYPGNRPELIFRPVGYLVTRQPKSKAIINFNKHMQSGE